MVYRWMDMSSHGALVVITPILSTWNGTLSTLDMSVHLFSVSGGSVLAWGILNTSYTVPMYTLSSSKVLMPDGSKICKFAMFTRCILICTDSTEILFKLKKYKLFDYQQNEGRFSFCSLNLVNVHNCNKLLLKIDQSWLGLHQYPCIHLIK